MATASVRAWLRRMDSREEPLFCARKETIAPAKKTPLTMAMMFPSIPPSVRESMKNSAMPPMTTAIVTQSSAFAFSFRKIHPRTAAYNGAVYWRKIAFAAVVSLFAQTKPIMQAA